MGIWFPNDGDQWQALDDTVTGQASVPISPVMGSAEDLARWLADNKVSAFAGRTATYEQWLAAIRKGDVCSCAHLPDGTIISGVEAAAKEQHLAAGEIREVSPGVYENIKGRA
jgi:hypothetical protein